MIILDTNVISEIMRPVPGSAVMAWLLAQRPSTLATTTISIAEIRYGFERLAPGRRRYELAARFQELLARGFRDRIFDFDKNAARAYGELAASRERAGRRLEGFDGLIAAVALSRGAAVATRNVSDFAECGFQTVNPWDY